VPRSARVLTGTLVTLGVVLGSAMSTAAAPASVASLSGGGAVLRPSRTTQVRLVEFGASCSALLTGSGGQCGAVHAAGGDLLYTIVSGPPVQPRSASRPWTVTVYRSVPAVAGGWRAALQTRPGGGEAGPVFATVSARTADLTGDGHESLVVGYRSEGTGGFLDVDVVIGAANGPRVAAHTRLGQGVVTVRPGQLTTYTPIYRAADANCCPSSIQRDEIQARHGSFVVVHGPRLVPEQAGEPPSDLA
jgi:hypothetical protein